MAALHLLGFGIALGPAWARARALREPLDAAGLRRVFVADNWWGLSAIVLIGTGLVRAFGGLEKGTSYYLANHLFLAKMVLLGAVLALEVGPMLSLLRWRVAVRRGEVPDTRAAGRHARASALQALLVAMMAVLAAGMARGFGE